MAADHQMMPDVIERLKQLHPRGDDPQLDRIAHVLEDLPEDAREQAVMIMDVPPGGSLAKRVVEVITDAAEDLYGSLEKVELLHFLAQYPVTAYTYPIDIRLSRGSRPNQAKLAALAQQSYSATVNLCAEMDGGDAPLISKAGLAASLKTFHIPITDMTCPGPGQVTELLQLLADPQTGRIYLHCEAGKARTGVMVACYRMAVMGWSPEAALLEAKNFGCSVPDQLDFIHDVGDQLARGDLQDIGYPREPLGSHRLTAAERDATVARAAAAGG
jgi:hypothetical protein